jgi:hypothetical protein
MVSTVHQVELLSTMFQQLEQEASRTADMMRVVQDALSMRDFFP